MKCNTAWHVLCLDLIFVPYGHLKVFVSMATLNKHVCSRICSFFGSTFGGFGIEEMKFILYKLILRTFQDTCILIVNVSFVSLCF